MKVGLFGGTFNPVHMGHLIITEWIRERFALQKIIFIPAFLPPHKIKKNITDIKHRLAMLTLAIADNPYFEISDVEIREEKTAYTIDTLRILSKKYKDLYFIIGEDSLRDFPTWKNPEEILEIANIVVACRRGFSDNGARVSYPDSRILFCNSPEVAISSTQIRQRVREGKSIRNLVHPSVEEYIAKNNLYKE